MSLEERKRSRDFTKRDGKFSWRARELLKGGRELAKRGGELAKRDRELIIKRGRELQNKLTGIFENGKLPYAHLVVGVLSFRIIRSWVHIGRSDILM